jgi:hypothetical protein
VLCQSADGSIALLGSVPLTLQAPWMAFSAVSAASLEQDASDRT